ncbi:MAG: CHAT domain-containing protein [Acidobacteriota bacterium]
MLGPDRAILVFAGLRDGPELLLEPEPAALTVITASEERRYPLARLDEEPDLASSVALFVDALRRRRGEDASEARRWHRDLGLDPALRDLPSAVNRLVLVTEDGPLSGLPFSRLLDDSGEPLAARYALSAAPSTAAWLRLMTEGASTRPGAVLAVVDAPAPALDAALNAEAEAVRRRFAGRIVRGDDAKPSALRELALERFTAVHLGSAQGPGFGAGLEGLDLSGMLVVRPARDGAPVSPKAVAEPFLRAGAAAVVVGRWPMAPDEAPRFYGDLYAGLAAGQDVERSLQSAQQKSRRRGDAAAVWASVVAVGRGGAVFEPLLPPLERWLLRILSGLVVAAMAVAGLAFWATALQGRMTLHNPWRPKRPRRR